MQFKRISENVFNAFQDLTSSKILDIFNQFNPHKSKYLKSTKQILMQKDKFKIG